MKKLLFLLTAVTLFNVSLSAEEFTVGVENIDYYPHYQIENGEYRGFARGVLDLFAKQNGHIFIYKPMPIKRLFHDFLEGNIDFKYPDNPYWQKEMKQGKEVRYSNTVTEYIDGVMVKKENVGKAKLKVLGSVMGFTPWEYINKIEKKEITLKENSNFKNLLKQAIARRVDGAYINTAIADYTLTKMGKEGALVFDKTLPFTKSSYFLSTIKHPKILKEFNLFLKNNKEEIEKLKKKFQIDIEK